MTPGGPSWNGRNGSQVGGADHPKSSSISIAGLSHQNYSKIIRVIYPRFFFQLESNRIYNTSMSQKYTSVWASGFHAHVALRVYIESDLQAEMYGLDGADLQHCGPEEEEAVVPLSWFLGWKRLEHVGKPWSFWRVWLFEKWICNRRAEWKSLFTLYRHFVVLKGIILSRPAKHEISRISPVGHQIYVRRAASVASLTCQIWADGTRSHGLAGVKCSDLDFPVISWDSAAICWK